MSKKSKELTEFEIEMAKKKKKVKDKYVPKKVSKFSDDFKAFAFKGNVLNMAVGIIIGAAFTSIVNSMVKDILTPLLSLLTKKANFENLYIILAGELEAGAERPATTADAAAAGLTTMNYGTFIQNIISFLLIAITVFMIVRIITRLSERDKRAQEAAEAQLNPPQIVEEKPAEPPVPTTKVCPFCMSEININAVKCPHCTSDLA